MEVLKEENGKKSMMRQLAFSIVIVGLSWGTIEIVAHLVLLKHGVDFDIHETLILTTISIGVTGKGLQKIIESNKIKK